MYNFMYIVWNTSTTNPVSFVVFSGEEGKVAMLVDTPPLTSIEYIVLKIKDYIEDG